MVSTSATHRSMSIARLIAIVLAFAAGLLALPAHANHFDSQNLTTLSDADVMAYRAEAMAAFYAARYGRADLTRLGDAEVATYRAEAMANAYSAQFLRPNLVQLTDAEIAAYRAEAMANAYMRLYVTGVSVVGASE